TPPAANSRAARNAHRSSPRAGSRLSCGDVMGYVILNRGSMPVGKMMSVKYFMTADFHSSGAAVVL
ncbi:hypothetical protein, partial [Ralstonia pseudosolanacearum]